jgi:hypothetical protein
VTDIEFGLRSLRSADQAGVPFFIPVMVQSNGSSCSQGEKVNSQLAGRYTCKTGQVSITGISPPRAELKSLGPLGQPGGNNLPAVLVDTHRQYDVIGGYPPTTDSEGMKLSLGFT